MDWVGCLGWTGWLGNPRRRGSAQPSRKVFGGWMVLTGSLWNRGDRGLVMPRMRDGGREEGCSRAIDWCCGGEDEEGAVD